MLKTRKALPKFRLFRKFKVDFFDFFSKSTRISRKYLRFYVGKKKRYTFWKTRRLKTYKLRGYFGYHSTRLFYRRFPKILKRFSFFHGKLKQKYNFFF